MEPTRDLNRIRLVTSRFWELQGLRAALIGTSYTAMFGGALVLADESGEPTFAIAMGLAFAAILPGMLWLNRYYESAFGRITPTSAGRRFGTLVYPGSLLALMMLSQALDVGLSLFFVGVAVFAAWIVLRDWPFRTYHLLYVPTGIMAALVQWRATDPLNAPATAAGFMLLGVAAAITGFLDHRLLVHTMKRSVGQEPVANHGDSV